MLLDDLGTQTMIEVVDPATPRPTRPLYLRAVDALIAWQAASQPGVLPPYDEALLARELALFPDWYLARHRGVAVEGRLRETLDGMLQADHRAQPGRAQRLRAPRLHAAQPDDARAMRPSRAWACWTSRTRCTGPITYDIASLMRDAFLSWDEEFVLDITVRYWQKALQGRPAGRPRTSASSTAAWNGWACSAT